MKRSSKIWIAVAAVAGLGTLTAAGAGIASDRECGWQRAAGFGGGMHHGRSGGYGGHGEGHQPLKMLRSLDADRDGKVTQAEIDQGRAGRHGEFDSNGDQALTLQEFEALWLEVGRERMVDRFQSLDGDGDGAVTLEEFQAPFAGAVAIMDRNDDGALGADDMGRHGRGWYHDDDDDDRDD